MFENIGQAVINQASNKIQKTNITEEEPEPNNQSITIDAGKHKKSKEAPAKKKCC
jgi:hypothetical protein